jgi:hypothetical protein
MAKLRTTISHRDTMADFGMRAKVLCGDMLAALESGAISDQDAVALLDKLAPVVQQLARSNGKALLQASTDSQTVERRL